MSGSYILRQGDATEILLVDTTADARAHADSKCSLTRADDMEIIQAMQAGATVVDLRKPKEHESRKPGRPRGPKTPPADSAPAPVETPVETPLDMPGERAD